MASPDGGSVIRRRRWCNPRVAVLEPADGDATTLVAFCWNWQAAMLRWWPPGAGIDDDDAGTGAGGCCNRPWRLLEPAVTDAGTGDPCHDRQWKKLQPASPVLQPSSVEATTTGHGELRPRATTRGMLQPRPARASSGDHDQEGAATAAPTRWNRHSPLLQPATAMATAEHQLGEGCYNWWAGLLEPVA